MADEWYELLCNDYHDEYVPGYRGALNNERKNMMNVFIDTQVTLSPKDRFVVTPPLRIGIGCVAQDAREYYLSETWQKAAEDLGSWFESLGDGGIVLLSAEPQTDWPRLELLFTHFGRWPRNLRRGCGSISFENANQLRFLNAALMEFWKVPVHLDFGRHALMMARSLAYGWWHANARAMSDEDFAATLDGIVQLGLQDGDIGYAYWWDVISKLKGLRGQPADQAAS